MLCADQFDRDLFCVERKSYHFVADTASNTASIITFLKLHQADVAITSLPLRYTLGMSVVNCVLAAGDSLVINHTPTVQGKFLSAAKERLRCWGSMTGRFNRRALLS